METIDLPGYLHHDKREIAKRHIIPRQIGEHGLSKRLKVQFTDEGIDKIISEYTREAGVRNLEREIASICRKMAKESLEHKQRMNGKAKGKLLRVDEKKIEAYLGVPRFRTRPLSVSKRTGSATGLAWTSVGGELLSVDVAIMQGQEKLTLTGQLGDVMKESAQAALSYLRSNAARFGLPSGFHRKREIHIHLPEGAIPKDGPSAGITLAMAMYSALSGKTVPDDIAMTGEITLRGNILAIGGLTEKLLAAQRNGIKKVLIPEENVKDLAEVPEKVKTGLSLVPIRRIEDALPFLFKAIPTRSGRSKTTPSTR
jgi:ATP-dependent Lon protease